MGAIPNIQTSLKEDDHIATTRFFSSEALFLAVFMATSIAVFNLPGGVQQSLALPTPVSY